MPFKEIEDRRDWERERHRKNRESPEFLEQEAKRKAIWYRSNKAKKRDAQRAYRERVRQQNLMKELKGVKNE